VTCEAQRRAHLRGVAVARGGLGLVAIATAVFLSACGNERGTPPDLAKPIDPHGFHKFRSTNGDIDMPAPDDWSVSAGVPPAVVTYASGEAAIAVWAYPRSVVPKTGADLRVAKRLLLRSLRKRDRSLKLTTDEVTKVNGTAAIELEGRGKIARHPVRIRSVHLYEGKGEYVVDAYADPRQFRRANRSVFSRIIGGIRVGGDPEHVALKPKQQAPPVPRSFGGEG
jgi:hypothetical protein